MVFFDNSFLGKFLAHVDVHPVKHSAALIKVYLKSFKKLKTHNCRILYRYSRVLTHTHTESRSLTKKLNTKMAHRDAERNKDNFFEIYIVSN